MSYFCGTSRLSLTGALLVTALATAPATAQVMIANDDPFPVKYAEDLVVDAPGILDNDLLDDESAPEMGAHAELVTGAAHGTLVMDPDGSFTYSPGPTFDGFDSFVYAAVLDAAYDEATVTLTACDGGPDVFMCWKETAFLALAADLGYYSNTESFEGPAWDGVRTPYSAPSVTNLGVRWTSNFPDAPGSNPISTTSGPPRTGMWAVFDPQHGYAEGTPGICDVDNPPAACLYHDGFTGEVVAGGAPLVGVGGYVNGTHGANVAIIIDDTVMYPGGPVFNHQFFGVIDTRPAGFNRFSFEEQDGKIGQALYIFGDDFTFLTTEPPVSAVGGTGTTESRFFFAGAGPNPAGGATTWRFSLPVGGDVDLSIYDVRGHLVRKLVRGQREAGEHAARWDSRDARGRRVPAGTYFGKLKVTTAESSGVEVRKIIILH
ncbi:MAG: Ig-like domain-containing protein [Candidatus Krumholzibacteriota bacterium]